MKLTEVEKWKDLPELSLRNQVAGTADPWFDGQCRRRIVNWEEIVTRVISQWKGLTGPASVSPPWMNLLLERLARHSRVRLLKFLDLWEKTPPRRPKRRDSYLVVWEDADFGPVRFIVVENLVDEWHGIYCKDLVPADSRASQFLEAIRAAG